MGLDCKKCWREVIFSETGETSDSADIVIAVYGKICRISKIRTLITFQRNLINNLLKYKNMNIPVVSVFLSGRPMWTNAEINNSDSFVAIESGSENGIADYDIQTNPSIYDFNGKLSFDRPSYLYI